MCRLRSLSLRVRGERALAAEIDRVEGLGRNGSKSEPVSDIVRGCLISPYTDISKSGVRWGLFYNISFKFSYNNGCAQGFGLFWRMRATVLWRTDAHKGGRTTRMRATYMTDACNPLNPLSRARSSSELDITGVLIRLMTLPTPGYRGRFYHHLFPFFRPFAGTCTISCSTSSSTMHT